MPNNPVGLPDVMDITLTINTEYSALEIIKSHTAEALLSVGYSHGIEMGTPSSDTGLGAPYVEEFLELISKEVQKKGRLLEIGAGTGYLSRRLINAGWDVVSLEPGQGYQSEWDRHDLEVVNDFYPSERIIGEFDTIVMYTVLEHIINVEEFMSSIKSQLKLGGQIVLAVPDCTHEISTCDPAMIIHEHARYFTERSLKNLLARNGFSGQVKKSKHGRSLFAIATIVDSHFFPTDHSEVQMITNYLQKINSEIDSIKEKIKSYCDKGKVAIYCPSRMLNVLSLDYKFEFIDDDTNIQGKYYPPFNHIVKGIEDLDPDLRCTLIIGSRTFFQQIRNNLPSNNWEVVSVTDLLGSKV